VGNRWESRYSSGRGAAELLELCLDDRDNPSLPRPGAQLEPSVSCARSTRPNTLRRCRRPIVRCGTAGPLPGRWRRACGAEPPRPWPRKRLAERVSNPRSARSIRSEDPSQYRHNQLAAAFVPYGVSGAKYVEEPPSFDAKVGLERTRRVIGPRVNHDRTSRLTRTTGSRGGTFLSSHGSRRSGNGRSTGRSTRRREVAFRRVECLRGSVTPWLISLRCWRSRRLCGGGTRASREGVPAMPETRRGPWQS
jgi:hypothetical protein